MKLIDKNSLKTNLLVHPYESNPDYFSYVNIFHYSSDGKVAVGYWEAPKGWIEFTFTGFHEVNYIIEGEMEITSNGRKITAKEGDCFIINDGDTARWEMKKFTRTFFYLYPLTKQIRDMIASWKKK